MVIVQKDFLSLSNVTVNFQYFIGACLFIFALVNKFLKGSMAEGFVMMGLGILMIMTAYNIKNYTDKNYRLEKDFKKELEELGVSGR